MKLWPIGAIVVAGGLLGAGAALVTGDGTTEPGTPPPASACNGYAALCSRSLAEVALPATHNSMSAPLPGWRSIQQDAPISEQLSDGIRGLLIDTHYGRRVEGRVRTDFASRAEIEQSQRDGVSDTATFVARHIRARLDSGGRANREIYLCHTFCELGATPLASVLDDLHKFLAANPGEVLVVVNEDYVDPADYVAAVRKAGLEHLALTPPASGRWPTLREMIDSDQRVVFLAEHHGGSAAWYQPAFERTVQDTPFSFKRPSLLTTEEGLAASCKPNRGPGEAPLLLLNHWITTDPWPLRSNASRVNAYEPLLRRARDCERLRGLMPNLLAVDFHRAGDVFRVARTLNGLP